MRFKRIKVLSPVAIGWIIWAVGGIVLFGKYPDSAPLASWFWIDQIKFAVGIISLVGGTFITIFLDWRWRFEK